MDLYNLHSLPLGCRQGYSTVQCILSFWSQTVSVSRGIISAASDMLGFSHDWVALLRAGVSSRLGSPTVCALPQPSRLAGHSGDHPACYQRDTSRPLYRSHPARIIFSNFPQAFLHPAASFSHHFSPMPGSGLVYDECL